MLVLSFTGGVAGEPITADTTNQYQDATVQLILSDSYSVTIPALFDFQPDNQFTNTDGKTHPYTAHGTVNASVTRLSAGEKLNVTVSSNGYYDPDNNYHWFIKATQNDDDDTNYYYKMTVGSSAFNSQSDSITNGEEILEVPCPQTVTQPTSGSAVLHLWLTEVPDHADEYRGQLTFTVNIESTSGSGS